MTPVAIFAAISAFTRSRIFSLAASVSCFLRTNNSRRRSPPPSSSSSSVTELPRCRFRSAGGASSASAASFPAAAFSAAAFSDAAFAASALKLGGRVPAPVSSPSTTAGAEASPPATPT